MEKSIQLKKTFTSALPVVLGYLPVGFAYGVLSANAGLTLMQTLAMSVFVFAGSAQLIAVGMIAQGINPLSIIFTTLIVNLRHFLMSAALSPHMKEWKKIEIAGFCYELTDETFAVHSLRFRKGESSPGGALVINVICQAAWLIGSILGVVTGSGITDVKPFALDYALPAMFIGLLLLQMQNRRHLWVALLGAALSLGLWAAGVIQWNVILATVVAATLGAVLDTRKNEPSPAEVKL